MPTPLVRSNNVLMLRPEDRRTALLDALLEAFSEADCVLDSSLALNVNTP